MSSSETFTFRLSAELRSRLELEVLRSERLKKSDIVIIALTRYLDSMDAARAATDAGMNPKTQALPPNSSREAQILKVAETPDQTSSLFTPASGANTHYPKGARRKKA